jgi:hypothetical protein
VGACSRAAIRLSNASFAVTGRPWLDGRRLLKREDASFYLGFRFDPGPATCDERLLEVEVYFTLG